MKLNWLLKGHAGFLLGLMILGTALLITGPVVDKQVLTAIGGALFGGSIGSLIAKIDGQEFQDKTLEVIKSTLSSKIVSDEDRVKRFRKKWHQYYQTRVDGKYECRHVILDLQDRKELGNMSGQYVTYDQNGKPCVNNCEGGLRDNRVIMFGKAESSDEPCSVLVLPFMAENYHHPHCGIEFHKTWDGNDAVDPAIVSINPIEHLEETGVIKDPSKVAILTNLWESKFCTLNDTLPNVKK